MKFPCLTAALVISFSACATTPAASAPATAVEPVQSDAPVGSEPTPAATAAVAAAPAAVEDKMICERVKELGSTRLKRVCKATSQRLREREAAREAMEAGSRER